MGSFKGGCHSNLNFSLVAHPIKENPQLLLRSLSTLVPRLQFCHATDDDDDDDIYLRPASYQ
jgi:hypothetical protein